MPDPAPAHIHWFRRDLRLSDNPALLAASHSGAPLIPLYILSDWRESHPWTGPGRQQFLCDCLASLDEDLRALGSRLILRQGSPLEVLARLGEEYPVRAIHFHHDPDPYGKKVEAQLQEFCQEQGWACEGHDGVALHRFAETCKDDGTAYRVYTPYSKRWLALEKPAPDRKPASLSTPGALSSLPLPALESWQLSLPAQAELLPGGEAAARQRLRQALADRLPAYAEKRDHPAVAATSRLSQDLRWGTLSIREVFAHAQQAQEAASSPSEGESFNKFIKELAWRDFYFHLLEAFPDVLQHEFNPAYRGLPWAEPGEQFAAWKEGRTGFPIVDAGMRELQATGFMHNRVRMITAMFLTKDLHLDWRLGEQHFAQHLLDGEIASNNGGWQWSAGTGADAAPYFRIQNPWTQSKRFDAEGDYIKKWVPELAAVAPKELHQAPDLVSGHGRDYLAPIVDHAAEREKTLTLFKNHLAAKRGEA
ncbi:cryptochrome/photolyase family protein [Roseibacillus ishigakijimensis]|uniref:Deoxyribodipyrimidine photo-lyase n=1 Tax=Roseibacillus ishigakijimensis TaxID=454146 RepID=A0A934RUN3_9BACT|nr:deoxyribodipyrimidine photo-lyase [Roseibacillus ishigakijimensis]MBK1834801.1 deoxyribodipyrimidine photo-lyase [Roseibacillus ishigakijimensis]